MKRLLDRIGYSHRLEEKNRYAYMIAAIGCVQLILFLFFYAALENSEGLLVQTLVMLALYLSAFVFFKFKCFLCGKIVINMVMSLQVMLLVWMWFPRDVFFSMYFFIVPPISFIVFDVNKPAEKRSLIGVNVAVTAMIILTGIVEPMNLIELSPVYASTLRLMSITMTFLVEVMVFFLYASSLAKTHKELRFLANTDVLTNVANRRVLFDQGAYLYDLCCKYDSPFTLMIIDIDYFKSINDNFGHPAGDKVLQEMTQLISENIRIEDLLCRYGGEEFAILFKNVDENQKTYIRTIKDKITEHWFDGGNKQKVKITFSAGVVSCRGAYAGFDDMVLRADQLLYEAKEAGRDRIILDSGDVLL